MPDTTKKPEPLKTPVPEKQTRSPNYPALSLREAVDKVAALYAKSKRFAVPLASVASTLDYGAKSSSFSQVLATLKAYGLIDVAGTGDDRKVSVSDRGMKIVAGHRDKDTLLREAALLPPIFRELWDRFYHSGEGMEPTENLKHYLQFDRPEPRYNDQVIDPLVGDFLATVDYAKLAASPIMSNGGEEEPESDSGDMEEEKDPKRNQKNPPGVREFTFPLIDGAATLRIPHPMGQANFDMLKAMLDAAKAALIGPPKSDEQ